MGFNENNRDKIWHNIRLMILEKFSHISSPLKGEDKGEGEYRKEKKYETAKTYKHNTFYNFIFLYFKLLSSTFNLVLL